MNPLPFSATPEGKFLDECISVISVIEARTKMLLAEYEHLKKITEREHLGHATEPSQQTGIGG